MMMFCLYPFMAPLLVVHDEEILNMIGEDDDFWLIALEADSSAEKERLIEVEDDECLPDGVKSVAYPLPTTDIVLHLESLGAAVGVWSPLGADAWYASALLTGMLLTNEVNILSTRNETAHLVVLELGSGAVGLSGLACAVALGRKKEFTSKCKVILTDKDPPVLEKLRWNVTRNKETILSSNSDIKMEISVQHLDWNDGCDETIRDSVDLVIGSELVYSQETAMACSKLLEDLLTNKKCIHIWVVQVTDRYGWLDIVVPRLEAVKGVSVVALPISSDAHDLASSMLSTGGTLDRNAFGAFCISNKAAA
jgi:predicted nicotinamide N-methyase